MQYTDTCMYIHRHIRAYAQMHAFTYTEACMQYTDACMYICRHMHARTETHVYTYICMACSTQTHACIYTDTCMHVHRHIHMMA